MQLTESRLKEIEDRLAKTTPGPWAHEWSGNEGDVAAGHGVVSMDHGEICRIRGHLPADKQAANGVFIAEAPNDIAELLGEVRWLRERLREQGLTETD